MTFSHKGVQTLLLTTALKYSASGPKLWILTKGMQWSELHLFFRAKKTQKSLWTIGSMLEATRGETEGLLKKSIWWTQSQWHQRMQKKSMFTTIISLKLYLKVHVIQSQRCSVSQTSFQPLSPWWLPRCHRGKEYSCQHRGHRDIYIYIYIVDPLVGRSPSGGNDSLFHTYKVSLLGKFHGQRPARLWSMQELDITEHACNVVNLLWYLSLPPARQIELC